MTTLRILNLNIWNYNAPWTERRARIVELIQDTEPDMVALQEIRYHDWLPHPSHQADQIMAGLSGYNSIWHPAHYWAPGHGDNQGQTCWEGLAILSRFPIVDQALVRLTRDPGDPRDAHQRLVLGAQIQTPAGPFWLFDTHYPLSADARERVAVETHRFVRQTAGDLPFVLAGDFNALPTDLPIRFLSGQAEIDGQTGTLVDAWLATHGPHVTWRTEPGYTFPAWGPARRIDYLWVPASIKIESIAVVGSVPNRETVSPSDHCGLLAVLEL
jgi:endonuclease/exonuclease/phosphatase family metal-dependent hydrolase